MRDNSNSLFRENPKLKQAEFNRTLLGLIIMSGNDITLTRDKVVVRNFNALDIIKTIRRRGVIRDTILGIPENDKRDEALNKFKASSPFLGQSNKNIRPLKNNISEYRYWSGFQVLDIDFKDADAAYYCKEVFRKIIHKFHWIHSISLSTSGNGLHIYTYTKPLGADISKFSDRAVVDYYFNAYEFKMISVWAILCKISERAENDRVITDEDMRVKLVREIHPYYNQSSRGKNDKFSKVCDMHSANITQCLYITGDADIIVNYDFELKFYEHVDIDYYSEVQLEKFKYGEIKRSLLNTRTKLRSLESDSSEGDGTKDKSKRTELRERRERKRIENSRKFDIKYDVVKIPTIDEIKPINLNNQTRFEYATALLLLMNPPTNYSDEYKECLAIFDKLVQGNPKYHAEYLDSWLPMFERTFNDITTNDGMFIKQSVIKDLNKNHGFDIQIRKKHKLNPELSKRIQSDDNNVPVEDKIDKSLDDLNNIFNVKVGAENFKYDSSGHDSEVNPHEHQPLDLETVSEDGYELPPDYYKNFINSEVDLTESKIIIGTNIDKIKDPNVLKIHLNSNEFISTYKDKVSSFLTVGLNFLVAPPGVGKTTFIEDLCNDNKVSNFDELDGLSDSRGVLLVLPYTSIITAKFNDGKADTTKMVSIHGDISVRSFSTGDDVCMTYDKFTQLSVEELETNFRVIAIDESHILMTSSFRGLVGGKSIELVKKISKIPVILMTGTPCTENKYLNFKRIIKITKTENRTKSVTFVECKDMDDVYVKIATRIVGAFQMGQRVLYPTNKGWNFTNKVIGHINAIREMFGIKKPFKYDYYKRSNMDSEAVNDINNNKTFGDVDLIFCTDYLSVGIDINDTRKKGIDGIRGDGKPISDAELEVNKDAFIIIYSECVPAHKIDQFNCRLRKVNLDCFIYFTTHTADGDLKIEATEYRKLTYLRALRDILYHNKVITHLSKENTSLGSRDAGKQNNYINSILSSYFERDRKTSEISLHCESFLIFQIEEAFIRWAEQLNVIRTILAQEYGYFVNYERSIVSSDRMIESVKNSGTLYLESAKNKTNNAIIKLISIMGESDFNADIISKIPSENLIVDSKLADDESFIIKKANGTYYLIVSNHVEVISAYIRIIRRLLYVYKINTIIYALENYCKDKNARYSYSAFRQFYKLVDILSKLDNDYVEQSNQMVLHYLLNDLFYEGNLEEDGSVHITKDEREYIYSKMTEIFIESQSKKKGTKMVNHEDKLVYKDEYELRRADENAQERLDKKFDDNSKKLFALFTRKTEKDHYVLESIPSFDNKRTMNYSKMNEIRDAMFVDVSSNEIETINQSLKHIIHEDVLSIDMDMDNKMESDMREENTNIEGSTFVNLQTINESVEDITFEELKSDEIELTLQRKRFLKHKKEVNEPETDLDFLEID